MNINELAEYLGNPNGDMRLEALEEARKLGPLALSLLSFIEEDLRAEDPLIRGAAVGAIHSITNTSVIYFEVLLAYLYREDNSKVQEALAYAISQKIIANNLSPIILNRLVDIERLLTNENPLIQRHICHALGYIETQKSLDILLSCIESPIADVRAIVVEAIIKIAKDPSGLLKKFIKEESDEYVKSKFLPSMTEERKHERTTNRNVGTCERSA